MMEKVVIQEEAEDGDGKLKTNPSPLPRHTPHQVPDVIGKFYPLHPVVIHYFTVEINDSKR